MVHTEADEPADAEALIPKVWTSQYPDFATKGRPGFKLDALMNESEEQIVSYPVFTVENRTRLFDEFTLWYFSWTFALLQEISRSRKSAPRVQRIYVQILSFVVSQHLAIRKLVLTGLDIPAKQLVRGLAEHLDLAVLLAVSPELRAEFDATDTPEASNAFWNKYMSKGKARRAISARLGRGSTHDHYSTMKEWRKEEEQILSMCVHPSLLACQMSLLGDSDERPVWPGCLGTLSSNSNRTLSYSIYASLGFLLEGYDALVNEGNEPLIVLTEDNELHVHISHGRVVLLTLLSFVQSHPTWPALNSQLGESEE